MQGLTLDKPLLLEIKRALSKIDGYGSIELYIQNSKITQVTARNISKTNNPIKLNIKA